MIVVTGVGRCGTSVMIKWLKACGLKIGADKWFDVVNAGFENKHTLQINQSLIRHFLKGEKVNMYHVKGDIDELNLDAVKDPQFLSDVRLIETWWEVRQDLEIVLMTRDPEEIVKSVYKVPEWSTPIYRTKVELIEQKEREFMDTLDRLEIPYIVVKYPEIDIKRVAEFCEVGDEVYIRTEAKELWESIFSI